MKKLFKFIGILILIFIIVIIIITVISNERLPYDKIENRISDKQYLNLTDMLEDNFTADRETAKRIRINNMNDTTASVQLDGYFVKIKVDGPGIKDDAIIFMGGDENEAMQILTTESNSDIAFIMEKSRIFYTMQLTDEWRALNIDK
jgi:hypothetical protein